MSQRKVEEWAAMSAQMQDDPSYHPIYNKRGVKKVSKDRGPNDLEEQIDRLKFRNEKLHKHNEKITDEIKEVRADNKKLAEQVNDYVNQLRKAGVI